MSNYKNEVYTFNRDDRSISGNADDRIKQHIAHFITTYVGEGYGFGDSVGRRLRLTEVSVNPMMEEPAKEEARLVYEIDVTRDMLNGSNALHGGCIAYFIDICSGMAIIALDLHQGGSGLPNVTQSINTMYHAPASLGAKLRIIGTTLNFGKRLQYARCEIWDIGNRRLVASGIHVKTSASRSKL